MSTPAVTQDAPAVSERHADILPSDRNYRLTGEMPEVAVPEIKPDPAPSGDKGEAVTAAAPAAAPVQEKGPDRTKTPDASESRWAKITRENRELRERLARLEGAESVREKRDTKPEAQPAADTTPKEPKIDDKDDKGAFKYKTIDEYYAAVADYRADQRIAKYKDETAKAQRERELQQAKERIQTEITQRVEKARKAH